MVSRNRDGVDEILTIFRSRDARHEPLTASEVADGLGCSRRVATDRLDSLVEADVLESRSVSGEIDVWWVPDLVADREETERTQELRTYETLLEESRDVNAIIEPDGTYSYLTPSTDHVLGYEPGELVGENAFDYIHPDDRDRIWDEFATVIENPEYSPRVELRFEHADGTWVVLEAHARNFLDDERINGIVAYTRDITQRKERERELEAANRRYRTLAENFPDGVVSVFDQELRLGSVGGALWEDVDEDPANLEGVHVSEVVPDETVEDLVGLYSDALDGSAGSTVVEMHGGVFRIWALPIDGDGEPFGGLSFAIDITEQIERQRKLEESRRRYSTVVENFPNGAVAMVDQDLRYLTVGGESIAAPDVDPGTLEGSHVADHLPPELAESYASNYEAALDGETNSIQQAVEDAVYRIRFVPVRDDNGNVFAAVGMSQDVTDQVEYEETLENQREHLAALNNLHGVVRDINDALVEQSTREEIERTVCRRLADSDSYRFAWVGDVDARTKSVELCAQAGVDDFFEAVDVSVDADDPDGQGLTGRAVRAEEVKFTNDALVDPAYEPWRDTAAEYGFRSAAAIPIVHRDTLYGVLGVYTERAGAFASAERDVVAQLGEIIGHAIAAIDRKHALMSDKVVEIELRIENVLDEVGFGGRLDGRVTFDETISLGDETYLQYGTASDGTFETVASLTETITHWEDVTSVGTEGDETQFELHLSEPPVISTVADRGGYVDEAAIENDTMFMTVHLPTTTDVRRVVDDITDAYSTTEMVTRRQVDRTGTREHVEHQITAELTDRQRSALEASFHAGFFEWPRESSGEDVADALGVSAPTFHQHLRKAQQKVLASLLD